VHGHEWSYVRTGRGPVLLLLHGLGDDHRTWLPVLPALSRSFTVIAPDLPGHGRSAKPRTDYSIAGYANGLRDLLSVLGVDKVTAVGHSLGGGVALQFAYQYPERVERLCLVAPGGVGTEVTVLLRALSLPGSGPLLAALTVAPVRQLGRAVLDILTWSGLSHFRDAHAVGEIYDHLADAATREAFRRLVRGVIDWRGQISTMSDRAYLTRLLPICVVWGDGDTVLPVRQAEAAAEQMPTARVEVLHDAGHFPHRDHPERFVAILRGFVAETAPATYHRGRWEAELRRGPAPRLAAVPEAAQT
jgi:pimeloyl-ACP methyl ester carboxylesterase